MTIKFDESDWYKQKLGFKIFFLSWVKFYLQELILQKFFENFILYTNPVEAIKILEIL